MNKRHHLFLSFSLILIGLGLFSYKIIALNFPLTPDIVVDVWNIEANVTFEASQNKPIKVSLFIPRSQESFVVSSEHFFSGKYGFKTLAKEKNRKVVWSIRKAKGRQSLYYRAVVRKVKSKKSMVVKSPPEVVLPELKESHLKAAKTILEDIYAQSADLDTLTSELFKRLNKPQTGGNISILLGRDTSILKKVNTAVDILSLANVPARIVHGIQLKEQKRTSELIHWIEVYHKKRWWAYNPRTGDLGLPDNYLAWWRGSEPVKEVTGGRKSRITIAVSPNQEEAIQETIERGKVLYPNLLQFSLFSLPIQTQAVYRILLLVPVGAFLLVILRNVIGLKTFGTFMPVLIAMAFRETQLLWGILLFSLVVAIGLGIRFYLERLKLLLVPRLASLLIAVVLLMAAFSILTHKLGLERGLSVALFPMIILTMTIERMSIVWEERGASEALQQGLGSLIGAAIAYAIITNRYIEHIVFVFPELLLLLLSGTLLLGRYSGYRLFELLRFKALTKVEH